MYRIHRWHHRQGGARSSFTRLLGGLLLIAKATSASSALAAIYSPTQVELFGVEFVDFIDNAEPDFASLDGKTNVGSDAVQYSFTTDFDINDALWRVAVENSDFALDLTPYDAFSITFSNPIPPAVGVNLSAQIFVRTDFDGVFVGSQAYQLSSASPVTISIPKSRIVNFGGNPADISSFGIEFFGGDEFLGTSFSATASTSPQPPTLSDHLLFSWETGFEGWTTLVGPYTSGVPHPDHTHSLSPIGATEGSQALRIDRAVTGNGLPGDPNTTTFRWGSRFLIDANAGGGGQSIGDYNGDDGVDAADYTVWRNNLGQPGANLQNRDPANGAGPVSGADYTSWKNNYGNAGGGPDPGALAQIANIVNLVNDPNAYSVSFDIRIEDQIPNPNPGWTNFFLSIQAANNGGDAWWQSAQVDVDLSPLELGQPVMETLDFPLSLFDDLNQNGLQSLKADGLDPATQYIAINLATNMPVDAAPVTYTIYIDNFRVRSVTFAPVASLAIALIRSRRSHGSPPLAT